MKTLKSIPFSIAILAAVTLISHLNKEQFDLLNIAMLYMLPILFAAVFSSVFKTALISFVSVVTFNLLFVPPVFSFTVHDGRYFLSFAIMFCIGMLVSILAKKATKIKELELSEKISKAVIGSLSYELRTPMAALIGASSTLLGEEFELSEVQKKSLYENIFESSTRMQKLIETLLAEARFAGEIKPIIKECEIDEMIGMTVSKYEQEYKKNADLKIEPNLPIVFTDTELLEQMFCILTDNAFKYGDAITIDAHKEAFFVIIDITNSGKMPSQKEMQNIGKKSLRFSNSTEKDGSGLGIHLCFKIAEIIGIRISIGVKNELFCVNLKIPAIA